MFTTCIDRHYGYKDTHGYIYLVRIDQIRRVIWIYDIRFHEGNPDIGDFLKNKIYKIIFDKIDKKEEDDVQISIRQS